MIWLPNICGKCGLADLAERERRERARAEAERFERFRLSELPPAYHVRRTLAAVDRGAAEFIPQTYGVARDLATQLTEGRLPLPWLYLYGSAGTFKTSLACATLADQIRNGAYGRYVNVTELLSRIRSSYNDEDADSEYAMIQKLVRTPRLVVDDLAVETPSPHAARILYQILDARSQEDTDARPGTRWVILTSNLTVDEACARLPQDHGPRILRRLADFAIPVEMN